MTFDFAVSLPKLDASINAVKARGETPTEENVKAEYIKRGGKVSEVKVEHVESPRIEDTVEVNKSPEVAAVAKPRRGRKLS